MAFLPLPKTELTLRELVEVTAQLLRRLPFEQRDGRATAEPDARTVRYYISLGIVDRPLGYRGNAGLYGERHVLQLLAAKTLQADGHSLPQIQARLLDRDDDDLARLIPPLGAPKPPAPVPTASLPAGMDLLLSVEVQPGLTVQITPHLLTDPDQLRPLADAVHNALLRAARALPLLPVPPETDR